MNKYRMISNAESKRQRRLARQAFICFSPAYERPALRNLEKNLTPYAPYEGPKSGNQIDRKFGFFDRKLREATPYVIVFCFIYIRTTRRNYVNSLVFFFLSN